MNQRIIWIGIVVTAISILFLLPKKSDGQVLDTTIRDFIGESVGRPILPLIDYGDEPKEKLKWWKPTKNDYYVLSLFALSGAADGINQSLLHHRLGENSDFWNVEESWKRKYRDFDNGDLRPAYFGSKTIFVWTTDGFHLTRAIDHLSMYVAIGISSFDVKQYRRKDIPLVILRRGVMAMLVRATVFNLVYNNTGKKP